MNLKDSYKSLYGEVPTPSSLINDMLNLLPIHFYKKKKSKIFRSRMRKWCFFFRTIITFKTLP